VNKDDNLDNTAVIKPPFEGWKGLIKVCGMKDPDNIRAVASLNPDYMGFIFYGKSPRYAGNLDPVVVSQLPEKICKAGVFVNETTENILAIAKRYHLNAIQLHGNETVDNCEALRKTGLTVIKAFSVASVNDLKAGDAYQKSCDYLLFDTKTSLYGGSGQQYDWAILSGYHGQLPFFLSGGISIDDAAAILQIRHPKLAGVDLNSKFEIHPGLKDVEILKKFMNRLKL
jgi:phosphoribosylanthranilate isomerase